MRVVYRYALFQRVLLVFRVVHHKKIHILILKASNEWQDDGTDVLH